MSVYSESFLQNNIVNYKFILIRNHKKKLWQEKQQQNARGLLPRQRKSRNLHQLLEESKEEQKTVQQQPVAQPQGENNSLSVKPRMLQRPMLARSKQSLSPKPQNENSALQIINQQNVSLSKLIQNIDSEQKKSPSDDSVSNVQPVIKTQNLTQEQQEEQPDNSLRSRAQLLISVQELDKTPNLFKENKSQNSNTTHDTAILSQQKVMKKFYSHATDDDQVSLDTATVISTSQSDSIKESTKSETIPSQNLLQINKLRQKSLSKSSPDASQFLNIKKPEDQKSDQVDNIFDICKDAPSFIEDQNENIEESEIQLVQKRINLSRKKPLSSVMLIKYSDKNHKHNSYNGIFNESQSTQQNSPDGGQGSPTNPFEIVQKKNKFKKKELEFQIVKCRFSNILKQL